MKKYLLLFMLTFIILTKNAYAYLDPGTGSMILQGVLAVLLGVSTVVGLFWSKIKSIFTGSKKEDDENAESDES